MYSFEDGPVFIIDPYEAPLEVASSWLFVL